MGPAQLCTPPADGLWEPEGQWEAGRVLGRQGQGSPAGHMALRSVTCWSLPPSPHTARPQALTWTRPLSVPRGCLSTQNGCQDPSGFQTRPTPPFPCSVLFVMSVPAPTLLFPLDERATREGEPCPGAGSCWYPWICHLPGPAHSPWVGLGSTCRLCPPTGTRGPLVLGLCRSVLEQQ